MAESAEFREQTIPRAESRAGEGAWRKIKLICVRTIFWSYERGTWQYDLIVLAILAFIFLPPREWFRDRPRLQLTDLRHNQGIVEVSHGKAEHIYEVDARLAESLAPENPEDAVGEILRRRLHKAFKVKSVEPVSDKNGVILGYKVVVTP